MQIRNEQVKSYAKITLTRNEILEKIGFDTDDAFDVHLEDWGRGGVTFTLRGSAAKYAQEEPSKSESVTQDNLSTRGSVSKWLGRFTGGGSPT